MRYVIVGGVAGGASTAARLRRLDENAEIILVEKGPYISYANCGLPYYIGDVIHQRDELFVQTPASFGGRFNIDVRVMNEVTDIDPIKKQLEIKDLNLNSTYNINYDKLVLSPGAEPIRPPLPGIDLPGIFTLRNVSDTDRIKSFVTDNKIRSVVIVGAGFIGLEMAENLHRLGIAVIIVELGKQILAPVDFPIAAIAQQYLRSKGIDLRLGISAQSFELIPEGIQLNLSDGTKISADMVLLSIGVRPDTKLASNAGLKLGPSKGIWVNEFLQTSDENIYAVGDAIEFTNPVTGNSMSSYLAGPANKQGRICADNIVGSNIRSYKGSINTAIVQLFDMTLATTGTAVKHLSAANIPYEVVYTKSGSHASYYPDSKQMTIQLAFSPNTGRLLGAQIAGFDGVDKRIDLLSLLIQKKGTISDLTELEHAYAPPYSSAKDPVNMAGFVAENLLHNKVKFIQWNEVAAKTPGSFLLDVRKPEEHALSSIPGAVNIPVDELRGRINELPIDKPIIIYCEIGLRGYLAHRMLKQKGFKEVVNLAGGHALWKVCIEEG
ncbi:MAG: FAD-dependent oxidoreductase [Chitinophagaceae bacterium]|nr:FAD-dependent oxidoreductase [Chitinophagaceae bacterium]